MDSESDLPPLTPSPAPPSRKYCAPYDYADADLILEGNYGSLYRVHSQILTLESPVFAEEIKAHRESSENADTPLKLTLFDDSIKGILDIIYPRHGRNFAVDSFIHLSLLVHAAEEYKMPHVITWLQKFICTRVEQRKPVLSVGGHAKKDALRCFVFAFEKDWDKLGRKFSSFVVSLDLEHPDYQQILEADNPLSPLGAVLKLQNLQKKRRATMLDFLYSINVKEADRRRLVFPKVTGAMTLPDEVFGNATFVTGLRGCQPNKRKHAGSGSGGKDDEEQQQLSAHDGHVCLEKWTEFLVRMSVKAITFTKQSADFKGAYWKPVWEHRLRTDDGLGTLKEKFVELLAHLPDRITLDKK